MLPCRVSKSGFTLVELVVVVLILGILAAVAYPKVVNHADDTEVTTIRLSLQSIQDQIDLQYAMTNEYPTTIDPAWFRGNKLPHHPLNGGAIPDVHVFTSDDREHPEHKTLDRYGAYWYNRTIGVVRARVPIMGSNADTVAFYNEVNQASVSSLNQKYD